MAKRNVGGARSVTRRTVILAGAPQYAGVAMAASIVPAVAQASVPARDLYADAVGHHFEAASEYGSYDLTLASVEELAESDAIFQNTYWHNRLFNPNLPAGVRILAFQPDWSHASVINEEEAE